MTKEIVTKSIWLTRENWMKISEMKYKLELKTMNDVINYILGVKNGTKTGTTNN
jgi:hypothetical protein